MKEFTFEEIVACLRNKTFESPAKLADKIFLSISKNLGALAHKQISTAIFEHLDKADNVNVCVSDGRNQQNHGIAADRVIQDLSSICFPNVLYN